MTPRHGQHPILSSADRMLNRMCDLSAESRATRREDRAALDPDVATYRAAKLARASRPNPALEDAIQAYQRLLANEQGARKGGRPRKIVGMNTRFGGRDREIR